MAKRQHSVEIVTVNLKFADGSPKIKFEQILIALDKKTQNIRGKSIEFNLLENHADYIVGLIVTTQDKDIPPKRNTKTGVFTPLGVTKDEGLAYANVFLYRKKHNILMYEFNKNGCYLEQFKDFVYRSIKNLPLTRGIGIDIKFATVFKLDEYKRAMDMRYYKSIEVEIAEPREVLQLFKDEHGSTAEAIKSQLKEAVADNASTVVIKYSVYPKQKIGLAETRIRDLINLIRDKILKSDKRRNVQSLIVLGYAEDPEIKKQEPIDLVGDIFKTFFKLEEPRVKTDVQSLLRKGEIKELYNKHEKEFIAIFGK